MDPNGQLSNNTLSTLQTKDNAQLVPEPTKETKQPVVLSPEDRKVINQAEYEVLHTTMGYIVLVICLLLVSTIISTVLISRVAKWLNDNTADSSPGQASTIVFYIVDSIFSFYYMFFLVNFIDESYTKISEYRFKFFLCPFVCVYLLSWISRIAVYINLGSYMRDERYTSLRSFDTVLFEFVFSVLIHLICHVVHFIPIVIYCRRLTVYRLRNNNNSTCDSIGCC